MSTSSPRGPTVEVVQEKTAPNGSWVSTGIMTIAIITAIFALVFHAGAAYMSYQRNQSIGCSIMSFFFAVFYYPYYAFFINEAPAPSGILGMTGGGMKKIMKWFTAKRR